MAIGEEGRGTRWMRAAATAALLSLAACSDSRTGVDPTDLDYWISEDPAILDGATLVLEDLETRVEPELTYQVVLDGISQLHAGFENQDAARLRRAIDDLDAELETLLADESAVENYAELGSVQLSLEMMAETIEEGS